MTLRRGLFVVLAAALAVPLVMSGNARASDADAARRAVSWIVSRQRSDGSFASGEKAQTTARMLAAAVSDGVTGTPVTKAITYIGNRAPADTTQGGYTGSVIAGIVAGAQDPRSFGPSHTDYVAKLKSQYDVTSGAYDTQNYFSNLIAANGSNAANEPLPDMALTYIRSNQCSDGGFAALGCSNGSDVDTTALAIEVLIASEEGSDPAIVKARTYLQHAQRPDGGFAYQSGQPTSSDSSALAITAMTALGEDAHKAPWRQSDGDDPVKALLKLQTGDGSFRANAKANGGNALSTMYAIPALTRDTYPIYPRPQSAQPTPTPGKKGLPAARTTEPPSGRTSTDVAAAEEGGHGSASVEASDGTDPTAKTSRHGATKHAIETPKPSPFVLGFGHIQTKPGGPSMAVLASIAVGATGAGAGLWFLRARLR